MQEEGDLLYVPSGWWHLVYNVCYTVDTDHDNEETSSKKEEEGADQTQPKEKEESKEEIVQAKRADDLCIAMTQNFCSRQNFHIIAALLSDEERKSSFARRFKEELAKQHPDLYSRWEEVARMLKEDRKGLIKKWGLVLKEDEDSEDTSSDSS